MIEETKAIIENRKKEKQENIFPNSDKLVEIINQLKARYSKFNNFTSQELLAYTLLLRTLKMKAKIENTKDANNNAVVAVYGATTIPIKRRIGTLKKLRDSDVDLNNGIILSGGRSWTGIVQTSDNFKPSDEEIEDYLAKEENLTLSVFNDVIKQLKIFGQNPTIKEKDLLAKEVYKSEQLYDVIHEKYKLSKSNESFDNWLKKDYLPTQLCSDKYIKDGKKGNVIDLFDPKERARKILWRQKILNTLKKAPVEKKLIQKYQI